MQQVMDDRSLGELFDELREQARDPDLAGGAAGQG